MAQRLADIDHHPSLVKLIFQQVSFKHFSSPKYKYFTFSFTWSWELNISSLILLKNSGKKAILFLSISLNQCAFGPRFQPPPPPPPPPQSNLKELPTALYRTVNVTKQNCIRKPIYRKYLEKKWSNFSGITYRFLTVKVAKSTIITRTEYHIT
jgi:hypothetical protein